MVATAVHGHHRLRVGRGSPALFTLASDAADRRRVQLRLVRHAHLAHVAGCMAWILNHDIFRSASGWAASAGRSASTRSISSARRTTCSSICMQFRHLSLFYLGWVPARLRLPQGCTHRRGAARRAGLQPWLWRRPLDAGGSDVGAVHRGRRGHAVALHQMASAGL